MNTELKFQTKEVNKFFITSSATYDEAEIKVRANFNKKIESWKTLQFLKFDSENHFTGDFKNTIFIYNHDHYRGNGSTWCSAEYLIHPNTDMDDRGYIKGIALDLTNYLLLRNLHGCFEFGHEFFYLNGDYPKNKRPVFKRSKNFELKMAELKIIDDYFQVKKNNLLSELRKKEDEFLKELTGLSINYYDVKF